jgi:hypothetical protein
MRRVVVLVLGSVCAAALLGVSAADHPAVARPSAATLAAEQWIGPNVLVGSRLLVDPTVRRDLVRIGWQPSALAPADVPASTWSSYDFVIATPAMRARPAPAAAAALASSSLLATFGEGPDRTDVLRVAPQGAAAADREQAALRAQSAAAGRQLATSLSVQLEPQAAIQVSAGDVDPRVLTALVALGSQHQVTVLRFTNDDGGGTVLGLLRTFALALIDGVPADQSGMQTATVASWFAAQNRTFAPTELGLQDDGTFLIGLRVLGPHDPDPSSPLGTPDR